MRRWLSALAMAAVIVCGVLAGTALGHVHWSALASEEPHWSVPGRAEIIEPRHTGFAIFATGWDTIKDVISDASESLRRVFGVNDSVIIDNRIDYDHRLEAAPLETGRLCLDCFFVDSFDERLFDLETGHYRRHLTRPFFDLWQVPGVNHDRLLHGSANRDGNAHSRRLPDIFNTHVHDKTNEVGSRVTVHQVQINCDPSAEIGSGYFARMSKRVFGSLGGLLLDQRRSRCDGPHP